jgi:hypothetical protein
MLCSVIGDQLVFGQTKKLFEENIGGGSRPQMLR